MKLRAKTPEELAEEHRKFIENPSPEWVEYNGFEKDYYIDGYYEDGMPIYRLKKTVKLLDTGKRNEAIMEKTNE